MSDGLSIDGMSLAPGVIETIVSIAANDIKGVASIGSQANGSFFPKIGSKSQEVGISIEKTDDDKLLVSLHVEVYYGTALVDIAAEIRDAVADALRTQVGAEVAAVDVFVDAIRFE